MTDEACSALLVHLAEGGACEKSLLAKAVQHARWAVYRLSLDDAANLIALFRRVADEGGPSILSMLASIEANFALRRGSFEEAIELALNGRKLALDASIESEAANCSNLIGHAYRRLGDYEGADGWYLEALVSARRAGSSRFEAGALSSRAQIAKIRGEVQSAGSMLARAVEIYSELQDRVQVARCNLNLGLLSIWRGQLQTAEHQLLTAADEFIAHGHLTFLASTQLAICRLYRLQSRAEEANAILASVLTSNSLPSRPRQHVIALEYLADLQIDAGAHEEAEKTLTTAIAIAAVVGERSDVFLECSYRLGFVRSYLDMGRAEALALVNSAVALATSHADQYELPVALLYRGRVHAITGEMELAVADFASCLALARGTGDRFTHAHAALELSRAAAEEGKLIDALGLGYEARTEFEALSSPRWLAETSTWLDALLARAVGTSGVDSSTVQNRIGSNKETTTRPVSVQGIPGFIVGHPMVRQLLDTTLKLASRNLSILLLGESGTGKELIADAIHRSSKRKGPFVAVNCGALPGDLLEAELFGHARGAYTGANHERGGLIEHSHLGTLFLDEIGDMPLKAQARLLRALERGEVKRLGENSPRVVDLRIVAATHRNLLEMVAAGEFRLDLYHRLTGFVLTIPPLRDRPGDVDLLIDHFLTAFTEEQDKMVQLSSDVRASLARQSWPGNVRQLRNVIHRLVSLSEPGQVITELCFDIEGSTAPRSLTEALNAEERRRIIAALEASQWNKAKAAASLGASRTTLIAKMKRLGIERPENGARVR